MRLPARANGWRSWKRRRPRLPKPVPPRPAPRLYLATPGVDDPENLRAGLADLLSAADVAAVLLRLQPADHRGMIARIKAIAPVVRNSGAALLLDGPLE